MKTPSRRITLAGLAMLARVVSHEPSRRATMRHCAEAPLGKQVEMSPEHKDA